MPDLSRWRALIRLLGMLLLLSVVIAGCGGKKAPTPVPTLPNVTVIPLTPTAQPAVPKYLPTRVPTQPAAPQPSPTPREQQMPSEGVATVETIGVTPTVSQPRVEVVVNQAHAYNGPGEQFVPVGVASAGDQLIVEERSPDGQWLHVCCFAGRPGWIAVQHVRPLTSLDAVPVATALPKTSPLPTPTPAP